MSERRPHWDDDLIEAIGSALPIQYDGEGVPMNPDYDDVYAVIAVVEDWVLNQPIFDWHVTTKHAQDKAEIERLTAEQAERDRRVDAALEMLDAELKYERSMGRHLSLTQISETLRGESDE